MSGSKQRTIPQSEYDRLRNQAAQAASLYQRNDVLQRMNSANEAARRQAEARLGSMNVDMNALHERMSRQDGELRRQLAEVARRSDEAVLAEARRSQAALADLDRRFHQDLEHNTRMLADAIAENDRSLRNLVADTAANLNNRIDDVRRDVASLQQRMDQDERNKNALRDQAVEFLAVAREIYRDTLDHFRAEALLGQKRRERAEAALAAAENHIRTAEGNPEYAGVARLRAGEAFDAILAFRNEAIQAAQTWENSRQAALRALNAAEAQLEAGRTIEAHGASLDVNHWSNGELDRIGEALARTRVGLENTDNATLEELQGYGENAALRVTEIQDAAAFALAAAEASQDRVELTERIARELEQRFLLLHDDRDGDYAECFEGGDERGAYRLHMRNEVTGFEIVITQTPVVQDNGAVATQVNSDIIDYGDLGPDAAADTIREILQVLGLEEGYAGGRVETSPGFERRASTLRVNQREWATRTERARETVAKPKPRRLERA